MSMASRSAEDRHKVARTPRLARVSQDRIGAILRAAYEEIGRNAPTAPELAAAVMTLELGLRWERTSLEFWTDVAAGQEPRRKAGPVTN